MSFRRDQISDMKCSTISERWQMQIVQAFYYILQLFLRVVHYFCNKIPIECENNSKRLSYLIGTRNLTTRSIHTLLPPSWLFASYPIRIKHQSPITALSSLVNKVLLFTPKPNNQRHMCGQRFVPTRQSLFYEVFLKVKSMKFFLMFFIPSAFLP